MTKLLLASTLSASLLGCAVEEPTYGTNQGDTFEVWKSKLAREPGTGFYIIDWDVVIGDEGRLYEHWEESQQAGALSIYRLNNADIKWSDAQKINLTYCIGATFGGNKQLVVEAMNGASVGGWEKFANVKFVYVPGQDANCNNANPNVMFDVNQVNSGGQYLARAFFPNSARVERNVLIDPASFSPQTTGGITLTNIVIHELGHTLGFRHEHIARPGQATQGCVEDANYRVIDNTYDQLSTMHYPQCGSPGNTLALSARDQTGVAAIYGAPNGAKAPVANIMQPTEGQTVPPTFSVDAMVVDADSGIQKVELFIDGTLYGQPDTTAPYQFTVTNLATGSYQLTIKATDVGGLTVTTSVTNVNVNPNAPNPDPTNPTNPGGGGAESNDVSGGCNTSGGSAGMLFALGLLGLVLRRRR